MITKKEVLKIIVKNEKQLKEYGVKRLGIFGSFVTSKQNGSSDIDVLVEFKAQEKTFDNYMELKFLLQQLLHREVDLVIKSALKPRIKPHIIKEVVYARL